MTTQNKLGIWMDHAAAYLTEYTQDPMSTTSLNDKFSHQEKVDTIRKSEKTMHYKEQQEQGGYYKQLGEIILKYTDVILFGPTDAKVELSNYFKNHHSFSKNRKRIELVHG